MSKLYITEYQRLTRDQQGHIVPAAGGGVDQTPLDFSGGAQQSSAFAAFTMFVRLATDAACSVAFGSNPTATTNNMRLAANQTEYFAVTGGQKLSVISNT